VSAAATWAAGGVNQMSASARIGIFDTFTLSGPSTAFGANLSFSVGLSGALNASNGDKFIDVEKTVLKAAPQRRMRVDNQWPGLEGTV
jgi:hypothetical protein